MSRVDLARRKARYLNDGVALGHQTVIVFWEDDVEFFTPAQFREAWRRHVLPLIFQTVENLHTAGDARRNESSKVTLTSALPGLRSPQNFLISFRHTFASEGSKLMLSL